jgi:Uma2 family endonuclease
MSMLDATWVLHSSRLTELTAGQKQKFLPLCPEFTVEIGLPSGRLSGVQAMMQEYLANGS